MSGRRSQRLRVLLASACAGLTLLVGSRVSAQEGPTATPIPISLVTPTPQGAIEALPTATWTATPPSQALLEPLDFANVRAEPSVDAAQLGVIRSGERYTIISRFGEWYQFLFDGSPTGSGWVFGQLVTVTGDPALIPEVTPEPEPTIDPLVSGATQTAAGIALTPGGAFTATAAARGVVATLVIPGVNSGSGIVSQGSPESGSTSAGPQLPTFTYPPGVVRATQAAPGAGTVPEEQETLEISAADIQNVPPILPILALGGLGALGLMLSSFRRK